MFVRELVRFVRVCARACVYDVTCMNVTSRLNSL